MRLDVRALWIDDQPRHVDSFKEGIQRRLDPLGFKLVVEYAVDLEAVAGHIGDHVHVDGIDLVLVDYDLGAAGTGDGALKAVRSRFPHKDIMFYSAGDRQKLREIAFAAGVDGVYFSNRLSLVNDTFSLIESMLSKVMDIDHMRGVAMSATTDIDFLVEESVRASYERLELTEKAEFLSNVITSLREKLAEWGKELDKAEQKGTVAAVFKLHYLCGAAMRLDFLLDSLAGWSESSSSYLNKAQVYRDNVIPRRNRLAHRKLQEIDDRLVIVGEDGPMSSEDMRMLRCELIEHRQNFLEIAVLMDVPLT